MSFKKKKKPLQTHPKTINEPQNPWDIIYFLLKRSKKIKQQKYPHYNPITTAVKQPPSKTQTQAQTHWAHYNPKTLNRTH